MDDLCLLRLKILTAAVKIPDGRAVGSNESIFTRYIPAKLNDANRRVIVGRAKTLDRVFDFYPKLGFVYKFPIGVPLTAGAGAFINYYIFLLEFFFV